MLMRFYRVEKQSRPTYEECFYVQATRELSSEEKAMLEWLIAEPHSRVSQESALADVVVVEIGPRLSVETPFSSNAVSICQSMGVPIRRIEKSTRYRFGLPSKDSAEPTAEEIIAKHLDPMTQEVYRVRPTTFDLGLKPKKVRHVDVLRRREDALREANVKLGLGMDEWDIVYYTDLFKKMGRNPTDVELFQIGNANSEHSRHWFFRGEQVINGKVMPETLMEVVKATLKEGSNSLTAFHDNSGVMRGSTVIMFAAERPGRVSRLVQHSGLQHITATAETHNHPTLIAPFPGAETGSGGRMRDNMAAGRGGLVHSGFSGYCVGNPHIPGYVIPGETTGGEKSRRHASPLDILIQGSNGVSDYGNKIGEPLVGGFCRTFGQIVGDARREFTKPVLYSAGLGRVLDEHVKKYPPRTGWNIVRIGGPAYRIGVGGGSASSMIHGSQEEGLDFKSVQRGNAEMENRVNRVIRACAELRGENPIQSIHDQGAGGPSNVLTELMEPAGGRVDIRRITVGDQTMSVLELWVAEYQEGYGLLVCPHQLNVFKAICDRERVNCEVLGEITGDGNVVVHDSANKTTPVNLSLKDILGELPRKRFESQRPKRKLPRLEIPDGLTVERALRMVFRLPHVGSKGFLVHKVDRSVTGLVARQQCCGPTQVPVSDVAVTADSYFGTTGAATALGEQPIKMLISSPAGARMAVAEMLTNLCSAKISKLSDVKCRANWMWAAKRPGEGALLYDAAIAMRDIMLELGIAIDGGKDSLSMATQVGDELVVSPGQLVIMGYAPVPDITKVVTPDLKGSGCLGYLKFSDSLSRLGGSALAQALGQVGRDAPDLDSKGVWSLRQTFKAVQELIDKGLITAYHDVSDGGLITAVSEMCIAGNRGAKLHITPKSTNRFKALFNEEAGVVFEYAHSSRAKVSYVMRKHGVRWHGIRNQIGVVDKHMGGNLLVETSRETWLNVSVATLREWWQVTSTELESKQSSLETVEAERRSHALNPSIDYRVTFEPKAPTLKRNRAPLVAILREEGTNGDREMAAAFYTAGLDPWDISMSDVLDGRVGYLDDFRGLVFPGGFSYADVFGSAKGWAGPILFNPRVRDMFDRFYQRSDTFSLGVCNGCQLMANIGWLPHKGIPETSQPRLVHNKSGRFESRWVGVRVRTSPSILLRDMEGSVLGINVAHGEGQFIFPDPAVVEFIKANNLVSLEYVGPDGQPTETYPYNPNGSPEGWTALCSPDGRHLAMMPHPERSFLKWQWPWMPEKFRDLEASPWLKMFQNAHDWCRQG